jgi:membrane protein
MSVVDTGRSIVSIVREENVPFMGASIAYYTIASIVPMLTVALVVLAAFGATDLLIDALRSNLSASAEDVLDRVLANTTGHGAAGALGFLLTLWSGSKVFQGISIAFGEVYDASADDSLPERVGKSLLVFGLLVGAIVLLSATSVALTYVQFRVPYPTLLGNAVALIALVLAFLPLYYVLPPAPVSVRHAFPGTVFAALGWVTLQIVFFYYAGAAGKYAAYGFLGAVLLFVTFLYLAGVVLVVGAVLNVVLEAGPAVTRTPARTTAGSDDL